MEIFNVDELIKLIKKGEDSYTQFKSMINSPDALASEICAFANTDGGKIVVGVSDNGEIIGVSDINYLNQIISNVASQKIEPPISVLTQNIIFDDKLVVIIDVPKGDNKPYAANRTDYWIKVGADKRRATREELRRLMQSSGNIYADEMVVPNTSIEDIDMYAFRDFYEKEYGSAIEENGIPVERLLNNLKLMKDSSLTLAGLLLFGKRPERLKPQFIIKAVSFIGNDVSGTEYLDNENIEGTIFEQYKNTIAFLKRNLRKIQKGQNVNLQGIIEIPEIALEEAVINAIVHRDYFIESSIRVFVFDDRVEIISPGKLPNTANIENIKRGIQIARNPILLSYLPKLKIPYRGIGSGIRRMIAECKKAGIKEPEFIEDKEAELFKVIFYRP
ncbi:RNA-binding domain-containing protein [Thermoanaerobacterium thermosaccharolyticum]|uniref:RNA-binding domain-containing protein n=1 Tax=Thermoanaerobacterium thermosaccharolyticum TaxID=1517 RepID=UPI003DA80B73